MAGSGTAHLRPEGEALLRVEHLVVEFPVGRTGRKVHAVSDVSIVPFFDLIAVAEIAGRARAVEDYELAELPTVL